MSLLQKRHNFIDPTNCSHPIRIKAYLIHKSPFWTKKIKKTEAIMMVHVMKCKSHELLIKNTTDRVNCTLDVVLISQKPIIKNTTNRGNRACDVVWISQTPRQTHSKQRQSNIWYCVWKKKTEAIVQVMHSEAPVRFREIRPEKRALVDGSRPAPIVPAKNT